LSVILMRFLRRSSLPNNPESGIVSQVKFVCTHSVVL